MKNQRGVFSLPWNVERGVWELFFEVRIVKEECDKLEEVVVAELVTKKGDKVKDGKLVLRRGVLGIQVDKSHLMRKNFHSSIWCC